MIGPEVTVPDITEPVIGYRQFELQLYSQHNYRLASPHTREPWPKPEMTARCTNEIAVPEGIVLPGPIKKHSAPHKDCGCGIYAYFEPCPIHEEQSEHLSLRAMMGGEPTYVMALVTMEGRIEVHSRGVRAQRARICALGDHKQLNANERAGLQQIANQFDVPLIHQSGLAELAPEYGRPLGEEMRPAEAKPLDPVLASAADAVAELQRRYSDPPSPLRGVRRAMFGATALNLAFAAYNMLHALGGP